MFLSIPSSTTTTIIDVDSEEVTLGSVWVQPPTEAPYDVDCLTAVNEYLTPQYAVSFLRVLNISTRPKGEGRTQLQVFFARWYDGETDRGVATTDPIYLVGNNGKTIDKVR